jgi:DNA polymerase iota
MAHSDRRHHRTIAHLDCDNFYVAVARRRDPSLSGKPVGIQQKYILATCSYEARAFGVGKLMLVTDALKLCPGLVLVDGSDLTPFREATAQIEALLEKHAPAGTVIERLVLEEFFLDLTAHCMQASTSVSSSTGAVATGREGEAGSCSCGCDARSLIAASVVENLRARIASELSLTASGGISTSKFAAKLASSLRKPNAQSVLPHHAVPAMIRDKPVAIIPGIGYRMQQRCHSMGIETVAQLRQIAPSVLASGLQVTEAVAQSFLSMARGEDEAPVVPNGAPLTISEEDSFLTCNAWSAAADLTMIQLQRLCPRIVTDTRSTGRCPSSLRVTVRHSVAAKARAEGSAFPKRISKQTRVPHVIHSLLESVGTSSGGSVASSLLQSADAVAAQLFLHLRALTLDLLRRLLSAGPAGLGSSSPERSATSSSSAAILPPFNLTLINVAVLYAPATAAPPSSSSSSSSSLLRYFGGASTSTSSSAAAAKGVAEAVQEDSGDADMIVIDDDDDDMDGRNEIEGEREGEGERRGGPAHEEAESAVAFERRSVYYKQTGALSPQYLQQLPTWLRAAVVRRVQLADARYR